MTRKIEIDRFENLLQDRRNFLSIQEISLKYSINTTWLKRFFTKHLSEEDKKSIRTGVFNRSDIKKKNSESNKNAAANLSSEELEIRNTRLLKNSLRISERIKNGEKVVSDEGMEIRRLALQKAGVTPEKILHLKKYSDARKKYFPDVIEAHITKLGLSYEGDLSSSENDIEIIWPDNFRRTIKIKRLMLLDSIEAVKGNDSEGQLQILRWIVEELGQAALSKRFGKFELDIYVPDKKIGIEFNGLFWHSEQCKDKDYHLQKTKFFEEKGIQVVHIFENEWYERKDQVKNYLRSKLGANRSIGARKCEFKEIPVKLANSFVEKHHIQSPNTRSSYALGIFHNDLLVGTATFGKHHRKNDQIVLNRFCCEIGVSVAGGLSKLTKMAIAHFKQNIVSWADYRLSNGVGYEQSGWIKEEVLPIDYFYWNRKTGVIPKQKRQKKLVGTPEGMTEAQHAELDGLLRIWDCGKIRFIYKCEN